MLLTLSSYYRASRTIAIKQNVICGHVDTASIAMCIIDFEIIIDDYYWLFNDDDHADIRETFFSDYGGESTILNPNECPR